MLLALLLVFIKIQRKQLALVLLLLLILIQKLLIQQIASAHQLIGSLLMLQDIIK
jgi:hypothetical protein